MMLEALVNIIEEADPLLLREIEVYSGSLEEQIT